MCGVSYVVACEKFNRLHKILINDTNHSGYFDTQKGGKTMGDSGFTTEEKRKLGAHFGEDYLMEIWREGEKRWNENVVCLNEVIGFMKRIPSEIVESGVGGFICKRVKEIANEQGRRPRKIMEEIAAIEDPTVLNKVFHQLLPVVTTKA